MASDGYIRTGDVLSFSFYMVFTLGVGLWAGIRTKTTEGYFLGGREVPSVCQYTGETDTESLKRYVVSLNLHRRHLNESQRALCVAKAGGLYKAEAKERVVTGAVNSRSQGSANLREAEKGKAAEKASEPFKVSARSVESANKVLEKGTPELVRAVEDGRVSVSAAAKVVKETPEVHFCLEKIFSKHLTFTYSLRQICLKQKRVNNAIKRQDT